MARECSYKGCDRKHFGHGLCNTHYLRWRRSGDASIVRRSTGPVTHGLTGTPAYRSWQAMLNRCRNPRQRSFPRYGGRGITVCERWLTFEAFLADMGERPEGRTLDRIDNDGNYEPSNCRWATTAEQTANKTQRKSRAGS